MNMPTLGTIDCVLDTLRECEEYFDQRADADQPSGESPMPNEEMKLVIAVRSAIVEMSGSHLISAAPDMLEALKAIDATLTDHERMKNPGAWALVEAAIAKATT